jgi:tetratricopeptide (TPR) repeat protein
MDDEGSELLRRAMAIEPDNADVLYALGLYLVRKHDYPEALDLLRRAHELMPDNARYAYVYAVAPEFERRSGRGVGAPGRRAPAASGGSKRLGGARLDCAGQREFCPGTPPRPRAADLRSRQRAATGSDRGTREEGEAVGRPALRWPEPERYLEITSRRYRRKVLIKNRKGLQLRPARAAYQFRL